MYADDIAFFTETKQQMQPALEFNGSDLHTVGLVNEYEDSNLAFWGKPRVGLVRNPLSLCREGK